MYFEKAGPACTAKTAELAITAAKEQNIHYIVVASYTGETAFQFAGCGIQTVCVGQVYGFAKPGENSMAAEKKVQLESLGIPVLQTTHVLSGAERGISRKFQGAYPVEIIAHTLRMLGQGMKVCVEISTMALDSGLIPYGERIIAVGGSGRGADTAAVVTPAHAQAILDTKIHRILCKPE